eukprot:749812-Hanusia_phi.AAC.4
MDRYDQKFSDHCANAKASSVKADSRGKAGTGDKRKLTLYLDRAITLGKGASFCPYPRPTCNLASKQAIAISPSEVCCSLGVLRKGSDPLSM